MHGKARSVAGMEAGPILGPMARSGSQGRRRALTSVQAYRMIGV